MDIFEIPALYREENSRETLSLSLSRDKRRGELSEMEIAFNQGVIQSRAIYRPAGSKLS